MALVVATVASWSVASASDARLAPLIRSPRLSRRRWCHFYPVRSGPDSASLAGLTPCGGTSMAGPQLRGLVPAAFELGQESLDHPALPGVVGQRLADDAAGQVGGQVADLPPDRGQGL